MVAGSRGLALFLLCRAASYVAPWMDPGAPPERRAAALLLRMNFSEKAAMLSGRDSEDDAMGFYIGLVEGSRRLGIPWLRMNDGPQGYNDYQKHPGTTTNWPSGLAIGASFDRRMAGLWGQAMGREFAGKGANVELGPGLCIARLPLNGRNFEYLSGEDPLLGYAMVGPAVRGIQSQGVIANAKHFINNNQETNRTTVSAQVDERTRFEIYYPPFEGAIEAEVGSMMCSYNRLSTPTDRLGNWSCEHPETLNRDLRERLNFTGWMMSDWGACHSTSIMQGLDQEMPGSLFFSEQTLNRSVFGYTSSLGERFPPTVTMARIDDAVSRILVPMFKVGLFDRPQLPLNHTATNVTSPAHNALARELARTAMVLLKNAGSLLPLDRSKLSSIALIGKDALNRTTGGGGSGGSFPYYRSTPLAAIRQRFAGIISPPPAPSSCPGKLLQGTDLANSDGVTSFPATSKCGAGPNCGQPNISFAECCALCQRRGDPRGWPGACEAFSYVGVWTPNGDHGLGRGLIYTCNLHGAASSPVAAPNGSCVNLTADQSQYPCSVATSGIIRSSPPPPAPNCSAGKCVYFNDGEDASAAAALAAKADVTVVFVSTQSGEGSDRSTLSLGDDTNALVATLAGSTERLVVVMVHPGAVLTPWREGAAAIIAAFMPGQEYGNAAADVLFGEDQGGAPFSPSARLPVTLPNRDNEIEFTREQWPGAVGTNGTSDCTFKEHCPDRSDNNCAVQPSEEWCQFSNYSEGLQVGYRWYHARSIAPAFAFGHGLAFTTFRYSQLEVTSQRLVSFNVTNNGSRPAAEVAQLYLTFPASAGEPPAQLKAFEKTAVLNPGESARVSMQLEDRAFSIWSVESHSWGVVRGQFELAVGGSSSDLRLSTAVSL